jgi:hypothetical protein
VGKIRVKMIEGSETENPFPITPSHPQFPPIST